MNRARRMLAVVAVSAGLAVLAGCGSRAATTSTSLTPNPTVESPTSPAASPAAGKNNLDAVLGPAGFEEL